MLEFYGNNKISSCIYIDNRIELQLSEVDDSEIRLLVNLVTEHGHTYNYFEERIYSKAEIKKAEYYDLYTYYPWQDKWKYARDFGTSYNEHGEQTSELIINTKRLKKYNICTILPELIVSEAFYKAALMHHLTGCEFGPVRDYKNREGAVFYQLKINNVLPRMSETVRTFTYGKTTYLKSEIIYAESVRDECKDFNLTLEHFNNFENPRVIVSKKVVEAMKAEKVKVYYDPIFFEE